MSVPSGQIDQIGIDEVATALHQEPDRTAQGADMTSLEIVATCIGLAILATLGVGFWKLLSH